jgi:hypothetical protein
MGQPGGKGKNYCMSAIDRVLILPFTKASVPAPSEGTQRDVCDRSSVEVERILPPLQADEPIQDPRNFYASDSPVFEEIDSDQERYKSADEFEGSIEPEGQGNGMTGDNNARLNVTFFHVTCVPLLMDASATPPVISTINCSPFPAFSAVVSTGVTLAVTGSLRTASNSR